MPISRKKACAQCRRAKARCSLCIPNCSRCMQRGLNCEYVEAGIRPAPYPQLEASVGTSSQSLDEFWQASSSAIMSTATNTTSSINLVVDQIPSTNDWSFGLNTPHDNILSAEDLCPTVGGLSSSSFQIQTLEEPIVEVNPGDDFMLLPRRQHVNPNAFLSTTAMLGQLLSYPKMMMGKTLPPFIHSRCATSDELREECASSSSHRCLSKTLSICSSLVQMFYSKTSANSEFVWKTIYTEHERLRHEYQTYDLQALLEALQAMCVYMLLQASDREYVERKGVRCMLATLGDLGIRLDLNSGYQIDDTEGYGLKARRDWIFKESVRRTMCLLYIFEAVVDVIIGDRDNIYCTGFDKTPPTCHRDLWETSTSDDWGRRYKEITKPREGNKVLTIRDLKTSLRYDDLNKPSTEEEKRTAKDVMEWCGGLDGYGMMVWMALNLRTSENIV